MKTPSIKTIKRSLRFPVFFLCLALAGFPSPAAAGNGTTISGLQTGVNSTAQLDEILLKIRSYEEGTNDEWMMSLREAVDALRQDPMARKTCELRLAAFLAEKSTHAATMAVCRHLRMIGTADSVPALKNLLAESRTADAARYALEKIEGPEAAWALLDAAQGAEGTRLAGLFSSIGARRMNEAVPQLQKGLTDRDPTVVTTAITALGHIGTTDSAKALASFLRTADDVRHTEAAGALLETTLLHSRSGGDSESLFSLLMNETMPSPVRRAAFREWMLSLPVEKAREHIARTLGDRDAVFSSPALDLVPQLFTAETVSGILPFFSEMAAGQQVQFLAGLTAFPVNDIRSLAEKALSQTEPAVRIQALRTLSVTGGPDTVFLVAALAAESRGEIQAEARRCLISIPGEAVDRTVWKGLMENKDAVLLQEELLRALSGRRIYEGKPAAFLFLRSPDPSLRREAVRACRMLCLPSDLPKLLDILLEYENDADRGNLGGVIALIAGQESDPLQKGDLVAKRFIQAEKTGDRETLLEVLGKIGDDSKLPLLRQALTDGEPVLRETAVRALCGWPNDTPFFDVMAVAETPGNPTQRVLAIRGAVRMIGLNPYRSPEGAVLQLKRCLEWADRPEEKIAVLGILPTFASPGGLELALRLENDPQVGKEAALAAEKIRTTLQK
ncbi:MAG: HEAT repeat domain-containing protein [Acidobacteria bacterium]|nr:HEAT repeat domain-containing protein [Acidobacteriota bacterium]